MTFAIVVLHDFLFTNNLTSLSRCTIIAKMAGNIFFGSLELQEIARLEAEKNKPAGEAEASSSVVEQKFVFAATEDDSDEGGHMVPIGGPPLSEPAPTDEPMSAEAPPRRETMELSESTRAAQEKHAITLIQLEAQRKARTMYVPTNNDEIKAELRKIGQPVTLFGEGPPERRERLRRLLAEGEVQKMLAAQGLADAAAALKAIGIAGPSVEASAAAAAATSAAAAAATSAAEARSGVSELFYTPASDALIEARGFISAYSFERASKRLAAQRAVAASPEAQAVEDAHAARVYGVLKVTRPLLSQPGDDRPMSCCGVTRDGSLLATGSWGSAVKIWDAHTAELRVVLRGHKDRVVAIAWHPSAGLQGGVSDSAPGHASAHSGLETERHHHSGLLATGSVDGTAKLWRLPAEALQTEPASRRCKGDLANQPVPVAGTSAHGSGSSSSMQVEDGDGSASSSASSAAASGLTPNQLLETGVREIATFSGHALRLCNVAWHPSGRYIGTSSFDRTWRLWDVASGLTVTSGSSPSGSSSNSGLELQLQEGHSKEVYALAFHPDGSLVASGDLGGIGRVWDLRSGKSIMTLKGHTRQLLALDWSPNGYTLASGSDDNTIIIWDIRAQRQAYTIPAHSSLISRVK